MKLTSLKSYTQEKLIARYFEITGANPPLGLSKAELINYVVAAMDVFQKEAVEGVDYQSDEYIVPEDVKELYMAQLETEEAAAYELAEEITQDMLMGDAPEKLTPEQTFFSLIPEAVNLELADPAKRFRRIIRKACQKAHVKWTAKNGVYFVAGSYLSFDRETGAIEISNIPPTNEA